MFIPFLYRLRQHGVPVGTQEALSLAKALAMGLHDSSLDGFYYAARALCVHAEGHLDAFDQAFLAEFRGIEGKHIQLKEELLEWLKTPSFVWRILAPRSASSWSSSISKSSSGCSKSA